MARLIGSLTRAGIATGTSEKTLMQIVAAANHRVLLKELIIGFDGVSNTDAPIDVILARQTDAGTMTALTALKVNSDGSETLQTSGQHTATAEPTKGDVLLQQHIHPQGSYHWQATFGGEIVVPGGGRLGLIVVAGTGVNANASLIFEE